MKFSLQRFLTIGLITILLCGGLSAIGLWYATHQTTISVERLAEAVESAVAAQGIQQNLAIHRRQALMLGIRTPEERRRQTEVSRIRLLTEAEELHRYASSQQEKDIIQKLQASILSYLDSFDSNRSNGARSENLHESVGEEYLNTQEAIQNLMSFNLHEAKRLELETEKLNRINHSFVFVVLSFLSFAFIVLLVGLRRYLYKPVIELKKTIENFDLGKKVELGQINGAQEIVSIASSFETLSQKLSQQKEQQLTFLSAIAHDLKNPLGAIKMSSELLAEETPLPPASKEMLAIISRQTEHLTRLISDLLDTTRLESGHLDLEFRAHDIRQMLSDSAKLHSNLSNRHEIHLNMPKHPVYVLCDAQRLIQVFNNLLNNAIKYSPKGGQIQVQLEEVEGQVLISITDSGVGILPEDLSGIFEPFRRSKITKAASIPGIGLGLSVARKILQAHEGGNISVKSEAGVGTTFTLRLQKIPQPHLSIQNLEDAQIKADLNF